VLAATGLAAGVDTAKLFEQFKLGLDAAYAVLDVKTFPGTPTLLATLRALGVKVALDTGYNSRIANLLLKKIGWQLHREYDSLVTSDDVTRGRPHPDMIHRAVRETGVTQNARVLKVGDSVIDIEEGINAGCGITLGVTTGSQTREQLLEGRPTAVVDSLLEMLPLICKAK
jgi:phosphonatase-like hydrolase